MYVVEVCQGPDCTGLGAGAALLEIEELVQESRNNVAASSLCVVEGGCRDFCTVGPNVHVKHRKRGLIASFNRVDGIAKCDSIVQNGVPLQTDSVVGKPGEFPGLSQSTAQSMMVRRTEKMRWKALRNVSRTLAKCKKDAANRIPANNITDIEKKQRKINRLKESVIEILAPSLDAERSAINSKAGRERAERRLERLSRNISTRLEACFEEEEDSDDSSCTSSHESNDNSI